MGAPFANLEFTTDEIDVICSALDLMKEIKMDGISRKQMRNNNILVESAQQKINNREKIFSANELRVMFASLNYFSILTSEENLQSDKQLSHESYKYKFITDSASYKLNELLLRFGIDIDSIS